MVEPNIFIPLSEYQRLTAQEKTVTVREVRKKHKLTQAELAKLTGIGRATYINSETGKRSWVVSELFAVAEVLGEPKRALVLGELGLENKETD